MSNDTLTQLVAMSRNLGDPNQDYVILGEGNTSARADADTFQYEGKRSGSFQYEGKRSGSFQYEGKRSGSFQYEGKRSGSFWVKASGVELRTAGAGDFVQVRFDRVLALLKEGDLADAEVAARLEAAKVDASATARPSVETVLHALALQLEGVNFIGHTHPTAVNALLCSHKAEEVASGRLFPDHIVYCGPASVYVPYTDPGLPLARKVRDLIDRYIDENHEVPKTILMQNHGLIALGRTARQVENITAMAVKAAGILQGAYAFGGPHFLSPQNVQRIHTRPDEDYRRKHAERP